jgi:RNA polymerase sigma-70 factor (ECF subfamily)
MLLRRQYDRIYGLSRRMLGNDQDAQDATQETLIAVVRGLPRFDGRSAFATWAYRIATNTALDELRRRRRRPVPRSGGAEGSTSFHEASLTHATHLTTWSDTGDAVGARLDVDTALARLPEEQRAAVVLRDLLDLDYAEIAEVLDIPIGTVRSRIARGRSALAALLREVESEPVEDRSSRRAQLGEGNSQCPPGRQMRRRP